MRPSILAAASCVLINLAEAFKMSSAIIQSFWIIISIIGLVRVHVINRRLKFTEDEKALIDFAFPGLSKPKARKILMPGTGYRETLNPFLPAKRKPTSI